MPRKKTLSEVIESFRKVHGDKYDYSKVEYKGVNVKICIICPIHGEFWQTPNIHLRGHGCKKCYYDKLSSDTNAFIEKARKVHGNKYDYSKVEYINNYTKVCIICPKHGEFWQTPADHLCGRGCPICCGRNKTTKDVIKQFKTIHNNKYDYSKVEHVNHRTKVCIICPKHGEFWQTPHNHLHGQGCPKCAIENISLTKEQFIEKARKIHGDKYDYSKVEYVNYKTKVCIICPKHGEFWQTPINHLQHHGCSICNESKLENEINDYLEKNNVQHMRQKRFPWLGRQSLDFYLPQYNIAIECQGEQHFEPIKHFGGKNTYKDTLKRDELKKDLCAKHNIKLLYYSHVNNNNNIITDKNKLLNEITNAKEK